ncbi:esterase/lipase family protein [Nocardioides sp.]|uniref:esterase/lipase family protein n=1 Tax=Nocardioides sp. TaxID=35761 RepID=UPI00352929B9
MRGAEQATADLLAALDEASMQEQLSVVVSQQAELQAGSGTRASGGLDDIVLEVPAPGVGNGQVLLYAAEDGSLSWHLPDDIAPDTVPTRGGERRTYRVPRAVVPALGPTEGGDRGVLGAAGTKVLKVLVFPLVDPVLGKVGDFFASRWEAKHRPVRMRWMTPDGYRGAEAPAFGAADWSRLGEGRGLLLVHGTFSTAHGAFGGLPAATVTALHDHYQGRVVALDHPSVSASPRANVDQLAGLLPDGLELEVDVVTHSRGGLVGRELAASGVVDVRRLVMVASPNGGTVLADRHHLSDLLDRVTDLAQFVPSAGVGDTLAVVLTVLKQLAVGAVGGLDGLTSMDPTGSYLKELNARPALAADVRAVAADYDPPHGSPLTRVARNGATDLVFAQANDLVVPTGGCWDVPRAAGVPVEQRLVLDAERGIDHCSFFGDSEVQATLLSWLTS